MGPHSSSHTHTDDCPPSASLSAVAIGVCPPNEDECADACAHRECDSEDCRAVSPSAGSHATGDHEETCCDHASAASTPPSPGQSDTRCDHANVATASFLPTAWRGEMHGSVHTTHLHQHGPACGHIPVVHEDHVDYLVAGMLHHSHGDHCDLHGYAQLPSTADSGFGLAAMDGSSVASGPGHAGLFVMNSGWNAQAAQAPPPIGSVEHAAVFMCSQTNYPVAQVDHQPWINDSNQEIVLHDNHFDFLVDGHLLHRHGDHLDDHGAMISDDAAVDLCVCGPDADVRPKDNDGNGASSATESGSVAASVVGGETIADGAMALKDQLGTAGSLQGVKCRVCKKKTVRAVTVASSLSATEKHAYFLKHIKHRFVDTASSQSMVTVLKGMTADAAATLNLASDSELGRRCRTLAELATLKDAEVKSVQAKAPGQLRNLKVFRNTALALIDMEIQEVNHQRSLRNAACCARFRQRQKEKTQRLKETVDKMVVQCDDLAKRLSSLEAEKKQLTQMIEARWGPAKLKEFLSSTQTIETA